MIRISEGSSILDAEALVASAPAFDLPPAVVTVRPVDNMGSGTGAAATPELRKTGAQDDAGGSAPSPAVRTLDGGRELRLHVGSARRADVLHVELRSRSMIVSLAVDGLPIELGTPSAAGAPSGYWRGKLHGGSPDGWSIDVALAGKDPLQVVVIDQVSGLPRHSDLSFEPRPQALIPHAFWPTDLSMVRSVLEL